MTDEKIRIFAELDDLIPEESGVREAWEIMKQFTPENPFNGVWYYAPDDELNATQPEVLEIIADYFDGTYDVESYTGFYEDGDTIMCYMTFE